MHTEDLELVERMLGGEEEAFATFAERYSRALYRFVFARLGGDRELTRETVQTAMTKALAKLDTYRGEASLLTWLCACCRNELLMHFRSRRSQPAHVELDEGVVSTAAFDPYLPCNPEADLLRQEEAHLVHMALDLLPSHYAQALEWKYLERLSVAEIAARMEMGPKAAESLLTRARQAFRAGYENVQAARSAAESGGSRGGAR